jgi:hypothetical protein
MGANGYEIRHGLMSEAKDLLLQQWHHRCQIEQAAAEYEKRRPVEVPLPSLKEMLEVAETFYAFVQRKD